MYWQESTFTSDEPKVRVRARTVQYYTHSTDVITIIFANHNELAPYLLVDVRGLGGANRWTSLSPKRSLERTL